MSVHALIPNGHTPPIGRYSPGIVVPLDDTRRLVFISGQVATNSEGDIVGIDDPAVQAEVVFANVDAVLRAAGGSLRDLVNVTIYLVDIAHFPLVSAVRNRVLGDPPPASTLVVVSRLALSQHLVEVSGVGLVRSDPARSTDGKAE